MKSTIRLTLLVLATFAHQASGGSAESWKSRVDRAELENALRRQFPDYRYAWRLQDCHAEPNSLMLRQTFPQMLDAEGDAIIWLKALEVTSRDEGIFSERYSSVPLVIAIDGMIIDPMSLLYWFKAT